MQVGFVGLGTMGGKMAANLQLRWPLFGKGPGTFTGICGPLEPLV